ncbi:hypothetical protein GA0070621_1076 [Micromonospora narathiwatensis]|uniref:Uncharacterized protein n=1 Tax=Micromonospora narathiwatensis TaxID=299146 RepID=A0A1A8ZAN1_9ACTN|nr:hypothetical protein GA0070621_1076 [Micromonospora narathiwatensis]
MRAALFTLARIVLRGVLPYPDLPRRVQVRRRARALATREPWPRDEAAVTGEGYARLALLRLLALQRATRRAVQTHQRESAPLLARTAMETCIVGLRCLHDPNAVRKLRESEIKVAPTLLTFMSSTGIIPDSVIREAVRALGEPRKLPDVRSMTEQIDSRTGATLAIHLYDTAYRPASQYFTHASGSALLRHVTAEYRYSTKPANSWARRAPVRLTDACVGLLAGALANQIAEPAELFVRYSEGHAQRVLPPLLVTIGKGMARRLRLADLVTTSKQAEEMRAYLSRVGPDDAPDDREKRLRAMYEALIARLDIDDVPDDAIRPVIDHLVTKVLAEWDAEHTDQLPRKIQTHEPGEA